MSVTVRFVSIFVCACMNLLTTDYMLVSLKYLNCGILIIQLLCGGCCKDCAVGFLLESCGAVH